MIGPSATENFHGRSTAGSLPEYYIIYARNFGLMFPYYSENELICVLFNQLL